MYPPSGHCCIAQRQGAVCGSGRAGVLALALLQFPLRVAGQTLHHFLRLGDVALAFELAMSDKAHPRQRRRRDDTRRNFPCSIHALPLYVAAS